MFAKLLEHLAVIHSFSTRDAVAPDLGIWRLTFGFVPCISQYGLACTSETIK